MTPTPRPWKAQGDFGSMTIVGPDRQHIATTHLNPGGALKRVRAETEEANAALIVQAVNSYDALREALRDGLENAHAIIAGVTASDHERALLRPWVANVTALLRRLDREALTGKRDG